MTFKALLEFDTEPEGIWITQSSSTVQNIELDFGAVGSGSPFTFWYSDRVVSALALVDGTLHGVSKPSRDSGDSALVTIDTTTGSITEIGPTRPFVDMAHDRLTGILWGIAYDSSERGALATIDPKTGFTGPDIIAPIANIGGIAFGPDGNLYAGTFSTSPCKQFEECGNVIRRIDGLYQAQPGSERLADRLVRRVRFGDVIGLTCGLKLL